MAEEGRGWFGREAQAAEPHQSLIGEAHFGGIRRFPRARSLSTSVRNPERLDVIRHAKRWTPISQTADCRVR